MYNDELKNANVVSRWVPGEFTTGDTEAGNMLVHVKCGTLLNQNLTINPECVIITHD